MVWVDLLDSVGGLKTLLGGYFGHFSPISCLNVSHLIVILYGKLLAIAPFERNIRKDS
ncbi:unknown protein [Microcystis aeruginosa NIES-843]|uniref:Uncharacterized protein n=1 Tax=Microcystis aeruginosa (strain NIES-843 / IAM M-2473) TaxID=449447 RepID=B0JX82_MICAN|nr:unknown protein [Microcystis aeruginosa NIES-843]